jgi:PAS domain S-box-containing protein
VTDDAQADPRADEGAPAPFPAPDGAAVNDFGMGLLRGDPACCELADTIPDGIYVLDTEGRFRFVNRTIVERSGMPRERFYDATYLDIILPKDHARVRGHFERVMAGGDPLPYVLDYGAAGDRTVSVEVNSRPIRSGGEVVGLLGISRDVTARRRAEEEHRRTARQLSLIMDCAAEHVVFHDTSLRMQWASRAAAESVGVTSDALRGRHCFEVWQQRDTPCEGCPVLAALDTGEQQRARMTTPDGHVWDVRAYPAHDADGTLVGAVEVTVDITGRAEAEDALRVSEEQYRALFHASADGVAVVQDGRIVTANEAACAIAGRPCDDLVGLQPMDLVMEADRPKVRRRLAALARGERMSGPTVYRTQRPDGSVRMVELYSVPIQWQGRPAAQSVLRDVTERVEAEQALRESEETYRALVQASPDAVAAADLDLRLIAASDQAYAMFGYAKTDEVLGRRITEFFPPQEAGRVEVNIDRTLHEGLSRNIEYTMVRKDGSTFIGEVGAAVLRNADGEARGLIATIRDVTERKRAEEALRQSEANYRAIFNAVHDMVFVHEIETGDVLDFNRRAVEAYGFGPDERDALNAHLRARADAPYAHADQMRLLRRAADLGPQVVEWLAEDRYGRRFWVEVGVRLATIGGRERLLAVLRDISDRKEAEARARLLTTAVEQSTEGVAVSDVDGNLLFVNEAFAAMHGYRPAELLGKPLAVFHTPDQMPAVEAANECIRTEGEFAGEMWHCRRDGSVFPSYMHNSLLRDERGEPVGMVAAMRDITDRKQAEQALRESEARYRAVVEAQTELVNRFAPDGTITFCNEALCRYLGKPLEELIGWSYFPLLPEDDRRRLSRALAAVTPEKPTFEIEHWIDHPDGGIRCTHWTNRGIFDDAGNFVEYQAVGRDVTDRKRAEEALRNSEARYRAVVESQTEFVCRFKPDHTLTFVNEAYCRYFGMAREDLVGREFAPLIVEADRERVRRAMASIAADNPVVTVEERVRRPDGEVRWQHWTSRGIFDETGRLVEIQGVGRDVTDRKQAEETLRRSEEAYRALFEESVDGIAITVGRRIVRANQALARLVGLPVEEVRGRDPITFIHPDDRDVAADRLAGEPQPRVPSRYRVVQPEGPPRVVEIVSRHVEWQGQDALQTIVRDITEQVRLQEQLQQAMKMEAVGQLAGGIAHDFNNLMTGILCHAGLLKSETGAGDPVRETAELIEHAARRAAELTSQLLGFARRGKQQDVPVDLVGTVETSVRLLSQSLPPLVSVQTDFHAPEAYVRGDPVQVEQVVLNLAMNARDAMPDGGTVTFAVDRQEVDDEASEADAHARPGTYIVLTVADTGVGIPEDQHSRVFEPFFTTKPQGKGTGMGLAMVYGIVRNHGGWIEVDSAPGRGTTFRVFFPAAEPPADGEPPPDRPLGRATVADRGRVLVVDDEELVRNVLVRMLASVGFEAVAAASGEEAVAYYREHGRDVAAVVIDFRMPGMDGRECYQALKAMDPDVRAVLATGGGAGESMQDLLDDGVDALVKKPFDLAGLDATLRRVLER